jgi:hypothetical protein
MRSLRRWLIDVALIDVAFFCTVMDIGYRVLVGSWLTLLDLSLVVMALAGVALAKLCVSQVRHARSRRRPDGI